MNKSIFFGDVSSKDELDSIQKEINTTKNIYEQYANKARVILSAFGFDEKNIKELRDGHGRYRYYAKRGGVNITLTTYVGNFKTAYTVTIKDKDKKNVLLDTKTNKYVPGNWEEEFENIFKSGCAVIKGMDDYNTRLDNGIKYFGYNLYIIIHALHYAPDCTEFVKDYLNVPLMRNFDAKAIGDRLIITQHQETKYGIFNKRKPEPEPYYFDVLKIYDLSSNCNLVLKYNDLSKYRNCGEVSLEEYRPGDWEIYLASYVQEQELLAKEKENEKKYSK